MNLWLSSNETFLIILHTAWVWLLMTYCLKIWQVFESIWRRVDLFTYSSDFTCHVQLLRLEARIQNYGKKLIRQRKWSSDWTEGWEEGKFFSWRLLVIPTVWHACANVGQLAKCAVLCTEYRTTLLVFKLMWLWMGSSLSTGLGSAKMIGLRRVESCVRCSNFLSSESAYSWVW